MTRAVMGTPFGALGASCGTRGERVFQALQQFATAAQAFALATHPLRQTLTPQRFTLTSCFRPLHAHAHAFLERGNLLGAQVWVLGIGILRFFGEIEV